MLSNNPALPILTVVLIVGGLIFALGTFMVRRESQAQLEAARTEEALVVSSPVAPEVGDIADRIGQIERLAVIGQPWCVDQLEREFLTDSDERIRGAAENALLVIRARR